VKWILWYVKGTLQYGLKFNKKNLSLVPDAFSDTDWAGCPNDKRSTSGFAVFLRSNHISWSSRKQATVSQSSTKAKYKALANATTELMWLQTLLKELEIVHPPTARLWCNNLSATYLSSNLEFHARMKHIEVDFHFVRERVAQEHLDVWFISSKDQLDDGFIKPINAMLLMQFMSNLNVSRTL
jgi:hypothetical protein